MEMVILSMRKYDLPTQHLKWGSTVCTTDVISCMPKELEHNHQVPDFICNLANQYGSSLTWFSTASVSDLMIIIRLDYLLSVMSLPLMVTIAIAPS